MKQYNFNKSKFTSGLICPFINYYQFFREVLFSLVMKGSFILFYNERNPVFFKTSKGGKVAGL